MSKSDSDALAGWLVGAIVVALFCAAGWYSAANKSDTGKSSSSDYSSDEERIAELESSLDEYKSALSEANDRIQRVSDCVGSAEDSVDYGLDAVLDELCTEDAVSEP